MRAPIFIIGYPRSGTSFAGKLIGKFTGFPSHGESHTMPLLQHLIHQINLYRRRTDFTGTELVKELDLQALRDVNIQFILDFYLRTYGSEQFIDKTPGPTACNGWGVVKQVFPNACFIACVRSPVEVYGSAVKKFSGREGEHGRIDPIEVAQGWVGAMQGIEKLAASLYAQDLHVMSQLELRIDPATMVKNLFGFLGLPDVLIDQGVSLCRGSREDVLTESIEKPAYVQLHQLELAPSVAQEFRAICAGACTRLGIAL